MAKPQVWVNRFFVGVDFAPQYAASNKYLLPARHIAWYESPLDAAVSIMEEQVGLKTAKSKIRMLDVQSHVRGDLNSVTKPPHWDICFVYETKVSTKAARDLKTPSWFKEFGFVSLPSLSLGDFTRGHGDILQVAGLLHQRKG